MEDRGMSDPGLCNVVDTLKAASGVSFHLHQFRHTFAVNFLKQTNNLVKLKELMGHSDIKTTLAYLRCLPVEHLRGDVASMVIDRFM